MSYDEVRAAILDACHRLEAEGLVAGASGNVSVRLRPEDGRELVAITPSQVPYRTLRADQVLVIDFEAEPVDGEGVPSSETLTHLAVYSARPDVGAVIHTHSVYASALAVAGQELPAVVDEQVVALGGAVQVAEYAMSATEQLSRNAVEALDRRLAVLLRSHGVVGAGRDLEEALSVVALVERVAKIYLLAGLKAAVQPLPANIVDIEQKFFRMRRGFPVED